VGEFIVELYDILENDILTL